MTSQTNLPIEIIEIEPCAVYQGTVYTQTVVARLEDGTVVSLFDLTPTSTTADMIGETIHAEVGLLPPNEGAQLTERPVGVYPPAKQVSEWSYDVVGEITTEGPDSRPVPLDIGCGVVYSSLPLTEVTEFGMGDRNLYIRAIRLDLNDCVRA